MRTALMCISKTVSQRYKICGNAKPFVNRCFRFADTGFRDMLFLTRVEDYGILSRQHNNAKMRRNNSEKIIGKVERYGQAVAD